MEYGIVSSSVGSSLLKWSSVRARDESSFICLPTCVVQFKLVNLLQILIDKTVEDDRRFMKFIPETRRAQ
jgi:hypothetical protein